MKKKPSDTTGLDSIFPCLSVALNKHSPKRGLFDARDDDRRIWDIPAKTPEEAKRIARWLLDNVPFFYLPMSGGDYKCNLRPSAEVISMLPLNARGFFWPGEKNPCYWEAADQYGRFVSYIPVSDRAIAERIAQWAMQNIRFGRRKKLCLTQPIP